MVKMTVRDDDQASPSKAAPPESNSTVIVDSTGRQLKIREPSIIDESRLVRMMGEAATNAAYMTGYVMPAVLVVEIDGDPVIFPARQSEVEAAIKRLGREGMSAVLVHITRMAGERADEVQEIKNSAGTPDSARPAG
jgi:hypothetical protein